MLISDRPTMLVCGHFGNFELSGYVLRCSGFRLRRSLGPWITCIWIASSRPGAEPRPVHHSQERQRPQVAALLAEGGILTLLADQHAGRQRLLGNVFRSAGIDAQSGRLAGAVERDADGDLLL